MTIQARYLEDGATATQAPRSAKDVFLCEEESLFFGHCIRSLVLQDCRDGDSIVEFGSGNGSPVVFALQGSSYDGCIRGYEITEPAYLEARQLIAREKMQDRYDVRLGSFFDALPAATHLIASTPYIPAADDQILLPSLWGGPDGDSMCRRLIDLGYENLMLLVSSYSNPAGCIEYACDRGYSVHNFLLTPMPFGLYSSDPKVMRRLEVLRKEQKAFYSPSVYLVAGVTFSKRSSKSENLAAEAIAALTALR